MTFDDLTTILRLANVALGLAAAIGLGVRVNDEWPSIGRGWRVTLTAIVLLLFALSYSSVEAVYQDAPVGTRTALVTVVAIAVIVGLALIRADESPPGLSRRVLAAQVVDVVRHADDNTDGLGPCQHTGCLAARAELLRLAAMHHPLDHAALDRAARDAGVDLRKPPPPAA